MSPDERVKSIEVETTDYTAVGVLDEPGQGNACHEYTVQNAQNGKTLLHVNFQNGPILEKGVNGAQNEDLLGILIHRLRGFQSGNFACRENALALTKIEEALMWLRYRTAERRKRGVEGKNIK